MSRRRLPAFLMERLHRLLMKGLSPKIADEEGLLLSSRPLFYLIFCLSPEKRPPMFRVRNGRRLLNRPC